MHTLAEECVHVCISGGVFGVCVGTVPDAPPTASSSTAHRVPAWKSNRVLLSCAANGCAANFDFKGDVPSPTSRLSTPARIILQSHFVEGKFNIIRRSRLEPIRPVYKPVSPSSCTRNACPVPSKPVSPSPLSANSSCESSTIHPSISGSRTIHPPRGSLSTAARYRGSHFAIAASLISSDEERSTGTWSADISSA
jgi:hypothetical protein